MNPARSLIVTSTLPSRAHSASTSATTSGAVTTVRTTSTSFMTGAGLKKCMPMTRLGRVVATEISVTDSDEVLVARIASGLQTRSSSAKICCLRSSCSGTASMTRSTSRSASSPTANVTRPSRASRSAGGELALGDGPVGGAGAGCARPRSSAARSISTATTSMPLRAKTSTMPAPIVPSPTTPTAEISRATQPPRGLPNGS